MELKFLTFRAIFIFSVNSSGGHNVGNGGDAIVCKKNGLIRLVRLYDFYEKGKVQSVPITGPLFCNLVSASLNAVLAGMGLGMYLSYQVEAQLSSGELLVVLADFEPPPLPVSVVYSHTKLMSTRVRVFVDWITNELRKDLRADEKGMHRT